MKKLLSITLALAMVGSFAGCNSNKRYNASFLQLFDTVTQIVAYSNSKAEFTEFSAFIHDELEVYHQLYDIYHDYDGINNIKTINDSAGKEPIKVDRRIIDLILFSKEAHKRTEGKCNVALGSVLKLWHQYREEGIDDPENAKLPSLAMLEGAAKHTDIDNIIIDEEKSTVFISDPEMRMDVGAVAKGYATEQVAKKAALKGYQALLSVGGNVRAIGGKLGEDKPWNVGVKNPDTEGEASDLFILEIKDESVVTSGIYERYYTVDGDNYHHIIDTETLMPSGYFKAVTIICRDSGVADELSTAVFSMPIERGMKLIGSLPKTEAVWVMHDGSFKFSENFEDYIKE